MITRKMIISAFRLQKYDYYLIYPNISKNICINQGFIPYFLPFCIILYLVERMASWVMPMMRMTSPRSSASPRRCFPKFAKTSLSEHKNSIFTKIHRVEETVAVPRHLLSSDRSQVSGSNFLHVNLEFSILVCTFACKYLEIQCHETSAECCYYVAGTYVLHYRG